MDDLLDNIQDSLQIIDAPIANSDSLVKSSGIFTALNGKQNTLEFDNQPTQGSQRMLTSGSIFSALDTKVNKNNVASSVQQDNNNPVSSSAVYTAIQGLTPGGSLIVVDDELSSTSENPVQNKVIHSALEEKVNNSVLANYATTSSLSGKAPTNHASSATTYGVGTDSNYGHLKITDNATNTAATSGIAISPKAVYTLTQTVNGKQDTLSSDNPLPVSSGGTGATSFTSGRLLIGNGTNAIGTRAITNNTSDTAAVASTNIPNMNTLYYTLAQINNADQTRATTIYAPTAGGTANTQALVGNGTTTAPKWVNISPSITITDGDASNAPKINVSVLGQSGTAQPITSASTSVYGVTKLTDSYTSTNKTLAATGASILAAIQGLDVSSVGGSGKYISAISETDGKISATATSTSVSNTWTNGTTNGPTIKTTVNGVTGTGVAIPSATATTSGIVTTDAQEFAGVKTFHRLRVLGYTANDTAGQYSAIEAATTNGTTIGSIYIDAGSKSTITDSRWTMRQYSPTDPGSTTTTDFSEYYRLPSTTQGLTSNVYYNILTDKNLVTIAQGGTGLQSSPSMLVNLSSTSADNVLKAAPRPGVTGVLSVAHGGTGQNTLAKAATDLLFALPSGSSVNTSETLLIVQGVGSSYEDKYYQKAASKVRVGGLTTARKLKVALGSTTDVTFDGTADQTEIPVSGTLPVARGGTGVTSLAALKTALDLPANSTTITTTSSKPKLLLTVGSSAAYPRIFLLTYHLSSETELQWHHLIGVQYAETGGIIWALDATSSSSIPTWTPAAASFKINFSEAATCWVLGNCNFTTSAST